MTGRFPLSFTSGPQTVGTSDAPMGPLANRHDGFVPLKRRDQSRLWFRMTDPAAPIEARRAGNGQPTPTKPVEHLSTDKLVSEMVRVVRATGPLQSPVVDEQVTSSSERSPAFPWATQAASGARSGDAVAPLTVEAIKAAEVSAPAAVAAPAVRVEWRTVQTSAPVLLLSVGPMLGSSKPGPILGPGMRYRILGMTGSVVEMEVIHANGDTRTGYANAVDLRCIEPRIQSGEFQTEKGLTSRLNLSRLATTTFGLFGG